MITVPTLIYNEFNQIERKICFVIVVTSAACVLLKITNHTTDVKTLSAEKQ